MAQGNGKGGNYGPSIPLTRLYERVSKNGNHYLVGRLGAAKIVILKSQDVTDEGVPIWNVLLSEGPPPKTAENGEGEQRRETNATPQRAQGPSTQSTPQRAREGYASGDREADNGNQRPQAERDEAARRDWQRPDMDDGIPF
jgi:hypothetical protein